MIFHFPIDNSSSRLFQAAIGKKVLLIDADPQGSLSISLGLFQPDDESVTLATVLERVTNDMKINIDAAIRHHDEGVDFVPANIQLAQSASAISLHGRVRSFRHLRIFIRF